MYHSHTNTTKQDNLGLVGGLIIEPKDCLPQKVDRDYVLFLQSWSIPQKRTMEQAGMEEEGPSQGVAHFDPVDNVTAGTFPENPESGNFNFETINGKAYPSTSALLVKLGERIRIRFLNVSQFNHPMHMHGQYFQWVASDGQDLPAPITENTVLATAGQPEDIEFVADNPGIWPLHCHLPHHVTNNGSSGEGGMFTVIKYIG
jgi:FtsP/CotA-like multicopper oxidase with cupredoxin domain